MARCVKVMFGKASLGLDGAAGMVWWATSGFGTAGQAAVWQSRKERGGCVVKYQILGTGSSGNCVIIADSIMIDIGLPYRRIQPHIKGLKLVLLTHEHGDHFKASTVRALAKDRPTLRWGCCAWMVRYLLDAEVEMKMIDVFEHGRLYHYEGLADVRPEQLVHDVPNCGYHIKIGNEWMFYATDTASLTGISAKGYALYLVESNYSSEEMRERIREKLKTGAFCYEQRVVNSHLSREQAEAWLYTQMKPSSSYVFLHQHQDKGVKQ